MLQRVGTPDQEKTADVDTISPAGRMRSRDIAQEGDLVGKSLQCRHRLARLARVRYATRAQAPGTGSMAQCRVTEQGGSQPVTARLRAG
jgi:hypothetical protein